MDKPMNGPSQNETVDPWAKVDPLSASQEHDTFAKTFLLIKSYAIAFLRRHLAASILAIIDLDTLEICNVENPLPQLGKRISDVAYKVRFKSGDGFIFITTEHLSNPDRGVALHLMANIVFQMLRTWYETKNVPSAIGVILYHSEDHWDYDKPISEIYDFPPELIPWCIDFHPVFIDLARTEIANIESNPAEAAFELTLQFIKSKDTILKVDGIQKATELFARSYNRMEFLTFVNYLIRKSGLEPERIEELIMPKLTEEQSTETKSAYDILIERGMAKGLAKGREEGREEGKLAGYIDSLELFANIRFGAEAEGIAEKLRRIDNIDDARKIMRILGGVKDFAEFESAVMEAAR
ncbi:MAG: Rpn family recombination-promoting nuclease/putative transposase [Planctomycetes bacterium]|nr:Rpn family recombination-promoting nuclease/putative transposase [Planctomycetota bacterium]